MKTSFSLFVFVILLLSISIINIRCSDDIILPESIEKPLTAQLESAFNGYFEWDRIDVISTTNPYISREISIDLPWEKGSSGNLGIPAEWLDENASDPNLLNRQYARENGWNLVYSNLHRNTATKYFALYNKYTGILRFFFYEVSSSSGLGSTESFWGIRMDRSSSLLNFTRPYAEGINKKFDTPAYVSTPSGTIMADKFVSKGYKPDNWYGLEIECAYDPSITIGSGHNFEIKGWAANTINIEGTAVTTGNITGTVTMAGSVPGFNLNLSNMFNTNSNKTIKANQDGVVEGVGNMIEQGISKNDPFFTGLWSNIKKNAVSGIGDGVKSGLKSIFSSGISGAVKALGGVLTSIIGGGKNNNIGKVELTLNSNSKITLTGSTDLVGWGAISSFPVPGSTNNPNDIPLYNTPLGVWNLKETPKVTMDVTEEADEEIDDVIFYVEYFLEDPEIILNPEIRDMFRIENQERDLVYSPYNSSWSPDFDLSWGIPCIISEGKQGYSYGWLASTNELNGSGSFSKARSMASFSARISFNLVNNNNPQQVYYFSRYFQVELIEGTLTVHKH